MPVKWPLVSERCKDCPKCGPMGAQNLYGLGPGVYPADRFPKEPAHFGCNCSKMVLSA
jgi:hypothetical protein